jgi:hypothetical protein
MSFNEKISHSTMRELSSDDLDRVGGGTLTLGPIAGITITAGQSASITFAPPPPAITNLVASLLKLL